MNLPTAIYESLMNLPAKVGGIGNDLVHLPTFEKSFNPAFIRRAFTPAELEYCQQFENSMLRCASTWAAKEAVYKAVKQYDETIKIWWRGIEILRPKPQGKPSVIIKKLPDLNINLTITHDGDYVWAIVCVH